jgi:hypothetical protein
LPFYYLDFLTSAIDAPLVYVRGNHDEGPQYAADGKIWRDVRGGVDIHGKVVARRGLILAGLQGSMRYKAHADYMYSESEMRRGCGPDGAAAFVESAALGPGARRAGDSLAPVMASTTGPICPIPASRSSSAFCASSNRAIIYTVTSTSTVRMRSQLDSLKRRHHQRLSLSAVGEID